MTTTGERAGFWDRRAARYQPTPGAVFLEDLAFMVRLPVYNGIAIVVNAALVSVVLFANDETAAAWVTVALLGIYVLALGVYLGTGNSIVYVRLLLWSGLMANIATHILLGGYMWSGGVLFWGIILSTVAALFLNRVESRALAGIFVLVALIFAFLEPTLQASRSQPELGATTFLMVNVLVCSLLILTPLVLILMAQITRERGRAESLLLNVLPGAIADRLKREPGVIADAHEACTVLFADLVGFTDHSTRVTPEQLIKELNQYFSGFDSLVEDCDVEKIKTIGDGYLAVAGATKQRADHVHAICELALRMQEAMPEINRELGTEFQLRVGINTGRLVAGVVGTSRFSYDLWGDTVNLASRMESTTTPGSIQVTEAVARAADDEFAFENQGSTEVKGVGRVETCLLVGRRR